MQQDALSMDDPPLTKVRVSKWDDQAVSWWKELMGRVQSQEYTVLNKMALDPSKTRKKGDFFYIFLFFFSILQRKNELGYEQKIYNVVGSSLCLIQIDESGWEN